MKARNTDKDYDHILRGAKRESQERSRRLVREGIRTQESMFFIPREVAKAAKIKFRD